MSGLSNLKSYENLNPEFLEQLKSFSELVAKKTSFSLRSWDQGSLHEFVTLSQDRKDQIQQQFQSNNAVFDSLVETEEEISEGKILESCAKKLGIIFDSDVYNILTKDHIIEVYNEDLIQIYRNLGFFNLCSYNLLDLLTHEFYELYERSYQVNSLLLEATEKLCKRSFNLEPVSLSHIPRHIMREKFSDEKKAFMIQFQVMYPIYKWSREFYGYLVIQEAREIPQGEANLHFI